MKNYVLVRITHAECQKEAKLEGVLKKENTQKTPYWLKQGVEEIYRFHSEEEALRYKGMMEKSYAERDHPFQYHTFRILRETEDKDKENNG